MTPARCIHDAGDRLADVYACPDCGNQAQLADFDSMGADAGCVFCNRCLSEFRPLIPMRQLAIEGIA